MSDSEDTWPTEEDFYQRLAVKQWPAWEALYWRLYPWMTSIVHAQVKRGPLEGLAAVDAEDVVVGLRTRWPNLMKNFKLEVPNPDSSQI